ncbi:hypothetical protein QSH57_005137 [Fusarium oxysporum f. sp. vasinfectum]|nr:hypothetical protein QSH57_005137 [Fusarium oxysporum f. sp. vasinfectum]
MESYMVSWPTKVGRKQRVVFACLPCHSRKIKCDRHRPCGRCVSAGRASECHYRTQQRSPSSAQTTSAKFSSHALFLRDTPRVGTATSWVRLIWEFEEARPYLFGTDPEYKDMFDKIKRLRGFFPPVIGRGFTFGVVTPALMSKSHMTSKLPEPRIAETLLRSYMETFEPLFPLWHEPSYADEMTRFWTDPQDADWVVLAQVFLMMSLGCHATSQEELKAFGIDADATAKAYFDVAAIAFSISQQTAQYNHAGLRTLCMSILARMMNLTSPNDEEDCSINVGLAVRIAQTLKLHRHPSIFVGMPEAEMITRIKIWTTLVLLDVLSSIRSSLPPVIHSGDYDACVNLGRDIEAGTPAVVGNSDESAFEHILAEFLPIASHVIRMANSVDQELDSSNAEKLDRELRGILSKATDLRGSSQANSNTERQRRLQSETLQIIIRRIMLTLHEPFGRSLNAAVNFKSSYIGLLECSLALAVSQGTLYDEQHSMRWALSLFKEDFKIALVYIALGIRGKCFDDSASEAFGSSPRSIAWTTLRRAVEITEEQAGDSLKHFFIYLGVCYLVAVTECLESEVSMRDRMVETGESVIVSMERIKGRRLKDISDASDLPETLCGDKPGGMLEWNQLYTGTDQMDVMEFCYSIFS